MAQQQFLAVDLGASSGRVVAGAFDGSRLSLDEVHRFPNGPVAVGPRLYWDLLGQWSEVQRGLRAASGRFGEITSVGVDSWGVDFALLGPGGELLGNPVHYRDRRTEGIFDVAFARVPRAEIFRHTGLQFMPFNTLFQLLALARSGSAQLQVAERLLMIPDLFHWLLTGRTSNELTNATTTQFFNPARGSWATELFTAFELPTRILGELSPAGTRLGPVADGVAAETGLAGVEVVLPGTHDTASAVMAVPAAGVPSASPDWCYISSGTWSLLGAELPRPVLDNRCLALNFTNEGGVGGTTRLLKNITGLWLVQECRRVWALAGQERSWEELVALADQVPGCRSLVDPDDSAFAAPGDMPAALREYCRATGQPVPEDEGAVIRLCLDSLALKCRRVLEWLEELVGRPMRVIHIVGGGAQNRRLCQATADACGRPVIAGPVEATAIGNLLVQAMATGAVGSVSEAREVIRRSFDVAEYTPRDTAQWDEAYGRFLKLLASRAG